MSTFEETKEFKLMSEMMNAYRNGDTKLDQFPDGPEKQHLLATISKHGELFTEAPKMSTQEVAELKVKLDSATDNEEIVKLITHVLDNYSISPEVKELLLPYKDLLLDIKKDNKAKIRQTLKRHASE